MWVLALLGTCLVIVYSLMGKEAAGTVEIVRVTAKGCKGFFTALLQLLMALGPGHALAWGLRVHINGVKIAQDPHGSSRFPSVGFAGSLWVCHVRKHQPCVSVSSEKLLFFNK